MAQETRRRMRRARTKADEALDEEKKKPHAPAMVDALHPRVHQQIEDATHTPTFREKLLGQRHRANTARVWYQVRPMPKVVEVPRQEARNKIDQAALYHEPHKWLGIIKWIVGGWVAAMWAVWIAFLALIGATLAAFLWMIPAALTTGGAWWLVKWIADIRSPQYYVVRLLHDEKGRPLREPVLPHEDRSNEWAEWDRLAAEYVAEQEDVPEETKAKFAANARQSEEEAQAVADEAEMWEPPYSPGLLAEVGRMRDWEGLWTPRKKAGDDVIKWALILPLALTGILALQVLIGRG